MSCLKVIVNCKYEYACVKLEFYGILCYSVWLLLLFVCLIIIWDNLNHIWKKKNTIDILADYTNKI